MASWNEFLPPLFLRRGCAPRVGGIEEADTEKLGIGAGPWPALQASQRT